MRPGLPARRRTAWACPQRIRAPTARFGCGGSLSCVRAAAGSGRDLRVGQYELTLNGARVTQGLLAPGWTDCDKTCLYDTLDVTPWARSGANAIGLAWRAECTTCRKDGTLSSSPSSEHSPRLGSSGSNTRMERWIRGTDEQWRMTPGPVTFANVYGGEDYDARRDPRAGTRRLRRPEWSKRCWWTDRRDNCAGTPMPLRSGHVRDADARGHAPVASGVTVYDLGQNASLMLWLKVRGPAGAVVRSFRRAPGR